MEHCLHRWCEDYIGFRCEVCGAVMPEWAFDPVDEALDTMTLDERLADAEAIEARDIERRQRLGLEE
jgi:hypothetical protein